MNTDEQNTWAAERLKQFWRARRRAAEQQRRLRERVAAVRLERLKDLERLDWGAWERS